MHLNRLKFIKKRIYIIGLVSLACLIFFKKPSLETTHEPDLRDFHRYNCRFMSRYGSNTNENKLSRINGDHFVCNDGRLKLTQYRCLIVSFGVGIHDQFEQDIYEKLKCRIHSLDPFSGPIRPELAAPDENSTSVKLEANWFFHRLGFNNETIDFIFKYLQLDGQTVDVLKLDFKGREWEILPRMIAQNIDLLCEHVKQIVLIAHHHATFNQNFMGNHRRNYELVKRLEICFRLFRRDHRFFLIDLDKSEWQSDEFYLNLKLFHDELDLAYALFTYGELYFVNKKFF